MTELLGEGGLEGIAKVKDELHERYFGHEHVTIIEPQRGWRTLDLKELWAYRELLWVLTARDVKVRYKQTVLGFAWAIIQPVMMMVVFSIFFGRLAQDARPTGFPIRSSSMRRCCPGPSSPMPSRRSGNSLVGSAQLVSKVYFPRLIIPLSSVGAGLVDFAISRLRAVAADGSGTASAGAVNLLAAPLLVCWRRVHRARRRHVAFGADRRLSRFPLRHSLHDPVLDVRDAGGLSGEPGAGEVALAALPQSHGRA